MGLQKHNGLNDYTIELIKNKHPLYGLIYNLSQVELEILKIYIKTHLKTEFIQLFKSFVRALICFD